ncbi:hypothetical protein [Kitasatospora sp. DSM 101779]|uniref:hypothetical protein n=1 Tax=Kitasatospora sp. DSM 101779 TaxID=2853165 RepID=UPI0021DA94BD|nr:hypothetical protein [Kitasatospora sp. DSM 101779]MCU7826423.1 hypothetical protein [Kitasatospora sp. DSM 101779]
MSVVRKLHEAGLTSEHAYTAAFASIGLSLLSWGISMKAEQAGVERADRWGIFVGEWAPTFFALGLALANHEKPAADDFR